MIPDHARLLCQILLASACCSCARASSCSSSATVAGDPFGARLGFSLNSPGDITGDGVVDLLAGAPTGASDTPLIGGTVPQPGRAWVISGADLAPLMQWVGDQSGDLFGYALAGIGDVDLDGVPDVAVGAPRRSSAFDAATGAVSVHSGASGAVLYRITGADPKDHLGTAVAAVGDGNFDGHPDFAIGAPFADSSAQDAGRALLLNGPNGATLKAWNGTSAQDHFGSALMAIADVHGDGLNELLIGAPNALGPNGRSGRATAFSLSGSTLWKSDGSADGDRYGASLAPVDDSDGDGIADMLIGAPGAASNQGQVRLLRSVNGALLVATSGGTTGGEIGRSVLGIADIDLDGRADFVTTVLHSISFYSGATGAALSDPVPLDHLQPVRGLAVAWDADMDGRDDLAIGQPLADHGPLLGAGSISSITLPRSGPRVCADPVAVHFELAAGAAAATADVTLTSLALPAVAWQATIPGDAPWLTVTPAGGTLGGYGSSAALSFAVEAPLLLASSQETLVTIVDPTSGVTLTTVPVSVVSGQPSGQPIIAVNGPNPIAFAVPIGAAPQASFVVNVVNAGSQDFALPWAAIADPATPWIDVDPANGIISAGAGSAPCTIRIDATTLSAGMTSAVLRIINVNAPPPAQQIEIPIYVSVGGTPFTPGDHLVGIAEPGTVDHAVCQLIDGLVMELKVGADTPALVITASDPTGATTHDWVTKGKNTKLKLKAKHSGPWRLAITAGTGTAGGPYEIVTRRKKLPSSAGDAKVVSKHQDAVALEFLTLPLAQLSAAISSKQGLPIASAALELAAGQTVDLTAALQLDADGLSLGPLPITNAGRHVLTIGGLDDHKTKILLTLEQPLKGSSVVTLLH